MNRRHLLTSFAALCSGSALDWFCHKNTPLSGAALLHTTPQSEAAVVKIDFLRSLVHKSFTASAPLQAHWHPSCSDVSSLQLFYQNEKQTLTHLSFLGSRSVPMVFKFDDASLSTWMPYMGPDLFQRSQNGAGFVLQTRHLDQMHGMYEEYRRANLFKINTSRPNLYYDAVADRLMAGDFKLTRVRTPQALVRDVQQLYVWGTKIHKDVPDVVRDTYGDMDAGLVEDTFKYWQQSLDIESSRVSLAQQLAACQKATDQLICPVHTRLQIG